MGLALKLIILICGALFVVTVIYLLVIRKINERNSLFWLFGSFLILILAMIPNILEYIAELVGVDYPPTLLFLASTLIILFIILYQSIQISILQERLKELSQHVAILKTVKIDSQSHVEMGDADEH